MRIRWHRAQVGGPQETTIADLHIARVASALGFGDLSPSGCVGRPRRHGSGRFRRLARGHRYGMMARAFAAAGDTEQRDGYVGLAETALAAVADPEDRDVVAAQLAEVRSGTR